MSTNLGDGLRGRLLGLNKGSMLNQFAYLEAVARGEEERAQQIYCSLSPNAQSYLPHWGSGDHLSVLERIAQIVAVFETRIEKKLEGEKEFAAAQQAWENEIMCCSDEEIEEPVLGGSEVGVREREESDNEEWGTMWRLRKEQRGVEGALLSHTKGAALYSDQGRRPSMEDYSAIVTFPFDLGSGEERADLFAIFDGHGGEQVSSYAKGRLPSLIKEALEKFAGWLLPRKEVFFFALKEALFNLQMECAKGDSSGYLPDGGTTLCCVLATASEFWVANVGDSRAAFAKAVGPQEAADLAKPPFLAIAATTDQVVYHRFCKFRLKGFF